MALPPTPVFDSSDPINPNVGYSTSGGASGIQNWHVHTQTVNIMYVRNNQYDITTSSVFVSPTVTSNWMDMNCTIQTQDEIYSGLFFSSTGPMAHTTGNLFQPQVVQIQSTSAGTGDGFGTDGIISTSSMGIIRRPVKVDTDGNILDTVGICTQNVNLVMNQMPGQYNSTFDTSSSTNGILAQTMGQLADACPSFKATLVEL